MEEQRAARAPGATTLEDEYLHEAFFYAGERDFLDRTTAFVREGVEADEPTLVVLEADKIAALRSELNGHADGVLFADMAEVGSNPARIIPAWREFVNEHAVPGRGLRGIGETIFPERSPPELVESQRHESLLNLAFRDTAGFFLLCPYDTSALDPAVIDEAHRSHPFVSGDGVERDDIRYRGLEELAGPFAEPLPDPQEEPQWRVFQTGTLSAVRQFVSARAIAAGFSTKTAEDLVVAVNEVATNSAVHGGGGGVLRIWREDSVLICEIHDTGYIDDPLAGYVRPDRSRAGGFGLWLTNQICDLVQVRTFAGGNAVRMHMRLPALV
jgi:anti-sigma regulatory factor (Ser/Thr protein kinase)